MSDKEKQGIYDYNGTAKINVIAKHENGVLSTTVHELMHLLLTKSTNYGQFVGYMNRVAHIYPKYKNSAQLLAKRMIEVQEGVATFHEYFMLRQSVNEHDFKAEINRFKKSNRQYYNYLKPLLFILNLKIDWDKEQYKLPALVKIIGISSLSFSFPTVRLVQLESPNKLKVYLDKTNINPDEKYKRIIAEVKSEFEKGKHIQEVIDNLTERELHTDLGWNEDFRNVLHEDIKRVTERYPTIFEDYSSFLVDIREVFSESAKGDFEVNPIDFVQPGATREYKRRLVDYPSFLELVKNERGSLYIKGVGFNKEKDESPEFYLEFIAIMGEINYYVKDIKEQQLHEIIEYIDNGNGVACSPAAYDFYNAKLLLLEKPLKRNMYVYFDSPYFASRMFLAKFLKTDTIYPAFYIEYPNFNMLVIQYEYKNIFLVPIFTLSTHTLDKDVGRYFDLNFIDTDKAKEEGRLNDNMIDVVDSIVNSILQTAPIKIVN
ncbi:hypothetical protein [Priestia megaterium]|uniref:hypothetical protein n=1 Tax=Priestia megaterium TaxID=1404 RepID=UPI0027958199|nr:hypothetical protein [Priestia megaterium]